MSSRTCLEALNDKLIYPARRANFDRKQCEIVGETSWHIPFIWLALFREDDLVEEEFSAGLATANMLAPIAERSKALKQLEAATESLKRAFPGVPHICGYVDLMLKELDEFPHKYFAIDLFEIEERVDTDEFRRRLRHCLRGFSDPTATEIFTDHSFLRRILFFLPRARRFSWKQSLIEMSGLNPRLPIPPADILLSDADHSEQTLFNFYRLMPGSAHRTAVWESEESRKRKDLNKDSE